MSAQSSRPQSLGSVNEWLGDPTVTDLVSIVLNKEGLGRLQEGDVLRSYRNQGNKKDSPQRVQTGKLKVVSIRKNQVVAQVLIDGSEMSKKSFPNYQKMMIDDQVILPEQELVKVPDIVETNPFVEEYPKGAFSYFTLFKNPKADPRTYELSEVGKKTLRKEIEDLKTSTSPLIMIKAFTDVTGDYKKNQVESYQRALTIKQFMVDEMSFHPDRVVAIGFGEWEPKYSVHVPGHNRKNRRVQIKPVKFRG